MRLRLFLFAVSILIIVLDQISKAVIHLHLIEGQSNSVIPFINLYLAHNEGAAFSMLSNAGGWQRWFLVALSCAASTFIAVWISRLSIREKCTGIGLALILGGAVGNLIDRVRLGHVIDFIDVYYPSSQSCIILFNKWLDQACHYATFNIADSAITVGVALLLIPSLYAVILEIGKYFKRFR